ncbi:hypothetical protein CTAYLR_003424 [Chrysophaeum taylorii]|uniref:Rab-GAP TBC domain-containing protein n=1 Tax=Chrysophaeum taylorii TaxID=2483200 RepID=A0AAD7XHN8_9STRA|nr:hypothetical protein CTAYLR_003424 [Chrysophaeum taylorii]
MAASSDGGPTSSTEEGRELIDLSERLESAMPTLMSFAGRCAMPDALRATAWKLFLRVVPPHKPDSWSKYVAAQRKEYEVMREAAMNQLDEALQQALPEADEEPPPECMLAALEDAADQIRGDLERCYPEGAGNYFLEAKRQKLMFDVLLVWSNQHPRPSYRQGMHELLAPLVWAMDKSFEATKAVALDERDPVSAVRVHPTYLEHDVYWMFDALADIMLPLYDVVPDGRQGENKNEVVEMCRRVQADWLRKVDPELHAQLAGFRGNDLVLPQIYMLSWLRLAFARQFVLTDVVKLWDAFFATCKVASDDSPIDYVLVAHDDDDNPRYPSMFDWLEAVATLLVVLEREKLLRATTGTACLRVLLRAVAPEPLFITRHARRLHADPATLQPLIASLRQHAHFAHILPLWVVSLLGSLGVLATAPRPSVPAAEPAFHSFSAAIFRSLLSMGYYAGATRPSSSVTADSPDATDR